MGTGFSSGPVRSTRCRSCARHGRLRECAFDRSATKEATAAKQRDNRAGRAELASRLLDKANAALDDMHKPALVFAFGGTRHQSTTVITPWFFVGPESA